VSFSFDLGFGAGGFKSAGSCQPKLSVTDAKGVITSKTVGSTLSFRQPSSAPSPKPEQTRTPTPTATPSPTPTPSPEPRLANSATGDVSLSQTEFNISEDNVVNLSFSVSDFAIDTADFKCGDSEDFVRFGTSPYLTSRNPYVFFGGKRVTPGGYSSDIRDNLVNKRDFPYVSKPVSSVTTKVGFTLKVSIPKNTVTATGACRVTGLVKTLDGKISQLDPGVSLSFVKKAESNSFTGGAVAGSLTLTRDSSPYLLKSPIVLGLQSQMVVQAGVEMLVEHNGPIFEGSGVGGIKILGTANAPVQIKNAKSLWKNPLGSNLEIRHAVFTNFGSIFDSDSTPSARPFGVEIYDSKFFGTRNGDVGGWRAGAGPLILERNYFENEMIMYKTMVEDLEKELEQLRNEK
jgi:hypothetical protein